MPHRKDSLYANPLGSIPAFSFDEKVAAVFPDMIQRSVPGYSAIISGIGLLAGKFCREGSCCYDLGCSLGAGSLSMLQHIQAHDFRIIAVDSSAAMIERFRQNLPPDCEKIELICGDILDMDIQSASMVVLNFTLQFIPLAERDSLLARIYQGLLPGSILILSEKLAFENARQQSLQMDLHHLFKKAQGYSDLEISQKRTALEEVLIPETFDTHQYRLLKAGFSSVAVWFQYFNFASMIALK
jgi:tRNA (cmo5U34)-methyltransferase